ncbi:unnamed protein product, partial [Pylaiella littoralis]
MPGDTDANKHIEMQDEAVERELDTPAVGGGKGDGCGDPTAVGEDHEHETPRGEARAPTEPNQPPGEDGAPWDAAVFQAVAAAPSMVEASGDGDGFCEDGGGGGE